MDNFKILIRLLTNQGNRSDIAFDFDACTDSQPLAAAARACFERADTMVTAGGISELDISVCDSQRKQLEAIHVRTRGSRAIFGGASMYGGSSCGNYATPVDPSDGFALDPADVELFHLAAHVLMEKVKVNRGR